MYFYKLRIELFDEEKVRVVDDGMVFIDPLEFFGSENVKWWNHRNDSTFEIDLDSRFLYSENLINL
jgi:hypothetical protein